MKGVAAQMDGLSRRDFCKTVAAGSALAADAAPRRLPNIVYVLADDLGIGDLDCYNPQSGIPTPNVNKFAKESIRFTDMHSPSAVCTPTRYGILTGRYCWRSRLKKGVLWGYSPNLIEEERMTVPSMLKSRGYYTAGVGKWHLGLGDQEKTDYSKPLHPCPIDHGFDYYFGIPASLDMDPYLFFENDRAVERPTSHIDGSDHPRGVFWRGGAIAPHFKLEQTVPVVTRKVLDILDERAKHPEQPFFLYFALPAPHTPWLPLPRFRGRSKAGDYGDYVAEVDDTFGQVLAALERNHLSDNTLVVFTSDNGADWKTQDKVRFAHRANDNWRGEKADIWDGGHRIPFLARWPGKIHAGSLSGELGCLTDLMGTAAAITGVDLPDNAGEDSYNLLPALLGRTHRPIREAVVHHSSMGMFAIRQGNWKLELGLGSGGFSPPAHVDPVPGGPQGQLYDLARDPGEGANLYLQRPEIVARLTALLEKYRREGHSRPLRGGRS